MIDLERAAAFRQVARHRNIASELAGQAVSCTVCSCTAFGKQGDAAAVARAAAKPADGKHTEAPVIVGGPAKDGYARTPGAAAPASGRFYRIATAKVAEAACR